MDSIPGLSQVKSLVQAITGDDEGALQTQKNFSKMCPVVSQVRSAVELIRGDSEAALNTQKDFCGQVNQFVNSIPGVGHVKGGIHYLARDREGGDMAMKAASRTTGVAIGGAAGFGVGGPVGAYFGGSAWGVVMDGIITVFDKEINGSKADEYGIFKLIKDIDKSDHKAGGVVDMVGALVLDGLTGNALGGEVVGRKNAIGRQKNAAKSTSSLMSKETKNSQRKFSYSNGHLTAEYTSSSSSSQFCLKNESM